MGQQQPKENDTMNTFLCRFTSHYKALTSVCSVLADRIDLVTNNIVRKFPPKFHDEIDGIKRKNPPKSIEEFIEQIKELYPSSFDSHTLWKNYHLNSKSSNKTVDNEKDHQQPPNQGHHSSKRTTDKPSDNSNRHGRVF